MPLKYLVVTENLDFYTTETIDQNLIDGVSQGTDSLIKFEYDTWWDAYIDENEQICWEEIN